MKWIFCGKNNAAVECLNFLVQRGDTVWAVGTAGDDGHAAWQRPFKAEAGRLAVERDGESESLLLFRCP